MYSINQKSQRHLQCKKKKKRKILFQINAILHIELFYSTKNPKKMFNTHTHTHTHTQTAAEVACCLNRRTVRVHEITRFFTQTYLKPNPHTNWLTRLHLN